MLRKQLPAEVLLRWEEHLAGCARCRQTLAAERAMLTVLDLGQVETIGPVAIDVDHLLERVPGLSGTASRRWAERLGTAAALLVILALAGLLAWQLSHPPADDTEPSADLLVAPELQATVVANLDALRTLAEEPWLIEHYETVLALDALLARPSP